ncbi:portal protein [Hyphomicrobium sp. DMF-1]|uniref:portal protein n=1 Tax=Hyphomicrobium sp. DMF-1 TaxID=3019544 RepID=UPI0022EBC864|nr:hypothetical protein [Hyphomicrobium sp. DMF-1]WBT40158.1 hypothetical protein PE058_09830 [Hyphomicrobium sp. DMF-1]
MAKPEKMTEDDLRRILRQEESDAAAYHDSELAKAQEDGIKRYFGEPYGTEKEGRSKVVTQDIADDVHAIMPDLMRCFTSANDLISIEALSAKDDQPYQLGVDPQSGQPILSKKSKVDIIAAYLAHIFFKDNNGRENIYDIGFDGLVQRTGIMQVSWEPAQPKPPKELAGVTPQILAEYLNDPEYEVLEQSEEEGPQGPVFNLRVRQTPATGRVYISPVPPEEFAIDKLARNIREAKYHRRKCTRYLAELMREFPDSADELDELKNSVSGDSSLWDDGRKAARFPDDDVDPEPKYANEGRREVILHHEFIRIDFDGDGIVELRQVKRVGNVILENIEVDASDYVIWSPYRVSHRAIGRSVPDLMDSTQRIRTELTRSMLDGLSQTLNPRTVVNTVIVDQDGIDALVDNEEGAIIPARGDVNAAMKESVTPDISGPALQALEYFDQRGQEASGVTQHSQGMDPTALNKTATGIDLLQAAGKTRVEMVAGWLGLALEEILKRVLQLLCAHQDKPRQVKLFGEWVDIDPRRWSDEAAITVSVGKAGVSRHQRLNNLMVIAAKQEQILMQAGPGNPLVTLQHYRNTLAAIAECMGERDASLFFGEVPEDFKPEPQPDPKVVEAQMKNQLETAKAQNDAQLAQQRMQFDQHAQAQKLASERELAAFKAQSEQQIAQIRIAMEERIAMLRMDMEMRLEERRLDLESAQAERDSQRQAGVGVIAAKAKAKANGSKSQMRKARPGGDLSK